MKVSASFSCVNLLNIEEELKRINESNIDFIHYDVVDGKFNKTFILGDTLLSVIRPHTDLPIEVHLAVEEPEIYIEPFIKAGADYIAVHQEVLADEKLLLKIRELGAKPILTYRAETEPSLEDLNLLKNVDGVLKLTVNPGFAGQKFQKNSLKHIKKLKEIIDDNDLNIEIQADGNINLDTIKDVKEAGATVVTGGTSGLFIEGTDLNENIIKLKEA